MLYLVLGFTCKQHAYGQWCIVGQQLNHFRVGHSKPIVTGLLIGAKKSAGKPGVVKVCSIKGEHVIGYLNKVWQAVLLFIL